MDALNVVLSRPLGHLDTHPAVAREPELVLGDDADLPGGVPLQADGLQCDARSDRDPVSPSPSRVSPPSPGPPPLSGGTGS